MSNDARAKLRYLRMSPRKVRLVADLIRGEKVNDALVKLSFTHRFASKPLLKLVNSAVANFRTLEGNEGADVDALVVKSIFVDEGPTMKRFQPRAMGRATMIRKRSSHVTVIVGEELGGSVGTEM